MVRLGAATVAALLAAWPAMAQHQHAPAHTSPYAGFESRPIKALSEQQVADLTAGRGMGLALAAELNGYPGPSHVIEMADKLVLTAEQRSQIETLFNSMKAEAMPIGAELIQREAALDRQFA